MKLFFVGSKISLASLTVCLLLLLVGAMCAATWRPLDEKAERPTTTDPLTSNRTLISQRKTISAESVTLTPRGFEPAEITRSEGHFVLNINNRSGLRQPTFLLTREGGSRMREVQLSTGKLSWREIVNLPPGRYRLTEVSHPDWVCQISVSGR